MNQSLKPKSNPNPNSNSNSAGIALVIPDRETESGRAESRGLVPNSLNESEVIACEIATLHLDLLFKCLHDFQLGSVSRARLIEHLMAHAMAVGEVREILTKVEVGSPFKSNEFGLSEKMNQAS